MCLPERPGQFPPGSWAGQGLTLDKMVTLNKWASARLQDTKSIDRNLLCFYILVMSYQKEKLRK